MSGETVEMESYRSRSLKSNLTFWFLLLALLPMGLVSWISFDQASENLTDAANRRLEQAADAKTAFIHNWFDYRFMDLQAQAENENNSAFLSDLKGGYEASGESLQDYVKSMDWIQRVEGKHNDLVTVLRGYDYIYDLFLIDAEGNVLYTVMNESDLGTNLFTGEYSETKFASSVRRSLRTGRSLFSDFEYYAPSNGALDGFLTAPLLDEKGNRIGVFAIQIEPHRIFENMMGDDVSESSVRHYLVGEDGRLRSGLGNDNEILKQEIDTEQVARWSAEHGDGGVEISEMDEPLWEYDGPDGARVLGKHHDIVLPGVHWALVSEIDRDETLASASWLGRLMLCLVTVTGLLSIGLGLFLARRITDPILNLVEASKAAAAGEVDQQVDVSSTREIGELGNAFNDMLASRHRYEREIQEASLQAKKALIDLEEQKFALDQHAIVAITNVRGDITFVNEKFSEISGYSKDELLGKNHRLLNSDYHDKSFFEDMYQTIVHGDVWHGEVCNRAKDGSIYWLETTITPFMGEKGKPESYIAIRTDITERIVAEQAMLEAKLVAEEASQAKSDFLANMSHEIRTPMNGVIGMTNLLLDSSLNSEQFNFAQTVKNSAESLLSLINDILDFSKVEAGKLDLEAVDFEIGELFQDLGATIAFKAQEKGVELICPANPVRDLWLSADPGRIRQILTNLIGNAVKFTEDGEVAVWYSIVTQEDGRATIRVEIVDTGIGLSPEQQGNLFGRFNQADGSTTRLYGGTGLGLAICKQLVELMGGEIGVESEPGQGSTFWFTLDLEKSASQQPIPAMKDLVGQKILVVDDNATNRELMDHLLTNWRVEHDLVDSGQAGLDALHDATTGGRPYDIAILDMQMPHMDGFEMGRHIKSSPELSDTRMLMFTSQAKRGDTQRYKEAGFSGYLSKPVNQTELYSVLLQVAGISSNDPRLVSRYSTRERAHFKARVLVVDDNATNQAVAKGVLEKFGVRVGLAANGEEALRALEQISYDMVFMDCQMPVMDGFEASRLIRDPKSRVLDPKVKVIAMTANAMQGDRERCLEAGMDDYISKPVDQEKLEQVLIKYLESKRIERGADKGRSSKSKEIEPESKSINSNTEEDPVFDFEGYRELLMEDEDLMKAVGESFLADMTAQFELLPKVLSEDDARQIHVLGHSIKGAAANVRGVALSKQANVLEQAGKAKDLEKAKECLPELERRYAELKVEIETALSL